MMSLLAYFAATRLALFAWALAVLLFLFACAVRAALDRRPSLAAASAVGALAGYVAAQCLLAVKEDPASPFAAVPVLAVVALLLASTAGAVGVAVWLGRAGRESVGPYSIKAAVDALPAGLLYFDEQGQVKLANARMESLSWEVSGCALQDGRRFWRDASRLRGGGVLPAGGGMWMLEAEGIEVDGKRLTEVVAYDVTAEARVNAAIEAENALLVQAGDKLRAHAEVAAEVVTAREVLQAKAAIHDALGQAAIATRRFVAGDGDAQGERVAALWTWAVSSMRNREGSLVPEVDQALASIAEVARGLGLQVRMTGEPPRTQRALKALVAATTEAAMNASGHAHATVLSIDYARADGPADGSAAGAVAGQAAGAADGRVDSAAAGMVRVVIGNDGAPPDAAAREGGGLGLARRHVEAAGGTMAVTWQPAFKLEIMLPDGEGGSA